MEHPVINVFQQIKVPPTHLVSLNSDMWSLQTNQSFYIRCDHVTMPVVLPKVFLLQAVYDMYGNILEFLNSWVARDVTKNQTKKLSILLSFYFHEVLQYLNIFT